MRHLDSNPRAADTVGGIARWWLAEDDNESTEVVESVVHALVAQGLMERRPTPDGAAIYGLARHK